MPFLFTSPRAWPGTTTSTMHCRLWALALLTLFATAQPALAQQKQFTFDDLFTGRFYGSLPSIQRWLKDGEHYLTMGTDSSGAPAMLRVNARTGEGTPFYDARRMTDALTRTGIDAASAGRLARGRGFTLNESETATLLDHNNDLYYYNFTTGEAERLTSTPNEDEENPIFSPDGLQVAFTRDNDLYVVGVSGKEERRLTRDGSETLYNGTLDWVYEEEIYGRGNTRGFAWSPDSRRIAFLRLDDSKVKIFSILDHLPTYQNIENWQYPKAGEPNPIATLGVVAADGKSAPRFVDVNKYMPDNRLIVRFAFHPDSRRLTFQVQPRNATFLDLNLADVDTGKTITLFRETTPAWVEILENPLWLKDGTFLWQSERTGHRHLYRYRDNGTFVNAVTTGEWDVRTVFGLDPKETFVYFNANRQSPIADHAYRAALSGTGEPVRLTAADGDHNTRFSPTFALFLDTSSSVTRPPELRLHDATDGKELRVLGTNQAVLNSVAEYRFSKPELLQVKTRDGFVMDAKIIRPPDFDPRKKYPVWMEVYAGPGAQTVRDEWSWSVWPQLLAQKGYIYWQCDNRSASGKGAKSAWTAYKKMGISELADIEDSLNYLKSLPYIDGDRIGISGWSYGGFMTAFALTHSKSFKCGIAGAPVTDWRLYDSVYTERYMDTPQANPDGYRATSAVEAAADCTGKLLLLHGMMDDNVHLQNSVRLVYGLEKAGKDFEMMWYPSPASRHGIGDPALNRHLRRLQLKFIEENL